MNEILTDKGIILVGEAAKSWVSLQWANSIVEWLCLFALVIGVTLALQIILKR